MIVWVWESAKLALGLGLRGYNPRAIWVFSRTSARPADLPLSGPTRTLHAFSIVGSGETNDSF